MSFLPDDYKIPTETRYMKFQEGENKFRILGSFLNNTAIMGYEYWITDEDKNRKPVRVKMGVNIPITNLEEDPKTGELQLPRHFWAFPVYNRKDKKIQILEITQKTVMNGIRDLTRNSKWGDPTKYDISVVRDDSTGKTAYSVMPEPKEELEKEINDQYSAMTIDLEKLFTGGDPFGSDIKPEEIPV